MSQPARVIWVILDLMVEGASRALLAPTNLLMDHKRARFARKGNIAPLQLLCLSLFVSDAPQIRIPSAVNLVSGN